MKTRAYCSNNEFYNYAVYTMTYYFIQMTINVYYN